MDATLTEPLSTDNHLTPIKLKAPRAWYLEFLLHFFTFGTYSNFWLVGRIREFKRIHNESYTPWLWIFVLIAPLAQLFALPKFINSVNRIEEDAGIPEWKAWGGGWIFAVFAISAGFNISAKYETPSWLIILALVLWAALLTKADQRIGTAKTHLTQYQYTTPKYTFYLFEILLLICFTPLLCLLCYVEFKETILERPIENYGPNTTFSDSENGYSLPIAGKNWRRVAIGTHSSGDTEVEFSGTLSDMYFVVFNYGIDESVSDLAYRRLQGMVEDGVTCSHLHELSKDEQSVIAKIACTSTSLGDPVLETLTIIETQKGIFELYGHLSSPKNTYPKYADDFKKMAQGFAPL
jgi:hypothetical protein